MKLGLKTPHFSIKELQGDVNKKYRIWKYFMLKFNIAPNKMNHLNRGEFFFPMKKTIL
jgi:hypothetical protein